MYITLDILTILKLKQRLAINSKINQLKFLFIACNNYSLNTEYSKLFSTVDKTTEQIQTLLYLFCFKEICD
jgi:hypothetical protein